MSVPRTTYTHRANLRLSTRHEFDRVPISVVMPTLNEEERIAAAVVDLWWADDVVVVDGGSTDRTRELARQAGARVITLGDASESPRTIAAQRNAGILAARHEWIFALDADERVTEELRASLAILTMPSATPTHTAYQVRSRNWHLGRELRHGPWGRDWKLRVFTRSHRYANKRVHEHIVGAGEKGEVGRLDGVLVHRPYRDLAHHITKVATYAGWGADDLHDRGRRARLADLLVRPAWRFFRDYVVYRGWKDGAPGFIVSVVSAFAVFAKYASLRTR